jgi:hypothetical protein
MRVSAASGVYLWSGSMLTKTWIMPLDLQVELLFVKARRAGAQLLLAQLDLLCAHLLALLNVLLRH